MIPPETRHLNIVYIIFIAYLTPTITFNQYIGHIFISKIIHEKRTLPVTEGVNHS